MSEITTRPMTAEDWPYVSKIYLEGIATEHATFQTTCPPYTAWDASHTKDCRLVVLDDGVVAGWAALHRVDPRWCYRGVVEVSIYVGNEASRRLHAKCGFRLVGRRERIARDCHGRWLDTFLMEHRCKEDEPTGYKKL